MNDGMKLVWGALLGYLSAGVVVNGSSSGGPIDTNSLPPPAGEGELAGPQWPAGTRGSVSEVVSVGRMEGGVPAERVATNNITGGTVAAVQLDEDGKNDTATDPFKGVLAPERLQPLYVMPFANNIKGIITALAFGFMSKELESLTKKMKAGTPIWDWKTIVTHIVTTTPMVFLAANTWMSDFARWQKGCEGYSFMMAGPLFLMTLLTSSNYGAAVVMWTKIKFQSPWIFEIQPKYAAFDLFRFPMSPFGANWMKPLTWLYSVILFPYLLVPPSILLVGFMWLLLALIAEAGILVVECVLAVAIFRFCRVCFASIHDCLLRQHLHRCEAWVDCCIHSAPSIIASKISTAVHNDWESLSNAWWQSSNLKVIYTDIRAFLGEADLTKVVAGFTYLSCSTFACVVNVLVNIVGTIFHMIVFFLATVCTLFLVKSCYEAFNHYWDTFWWYGVFQWWVFPYFLLMLFLAVVVPIGFTMVWAILQYDANEIKEKMCNDILENSSAGLAAYSRLSAYQKRQNTKEAETGSCETRIAELERAGQASGLEEVKKTLLSRKGTKELTADMKSYVCLDVLSLFIPLATYNPTKAEHVKAAKVLYYEALEADFYVGEPLLGEAGERARWTFDQTAFNRVALQTMLKAGSYVMSQTVMGITILRLIVDLGMNPETMSFQSFRKAFGQTLWERHLFSYLDTCFSALMTKVSSSSHFFDVLWNML